MPGLNRTGPRGMGPMTGRRMGHCAGNNTPEILNQSPRFGLRRGFGRGTGLGFGRGAGFGRSFGWRRMEFTPPIAPAAKYTYQEPAYPQPTQPTKEQETQIIEEDIKYLEAEQKEINTELDATRKRLEEIRK